MPDLEPGEGNRSPMRHRHPVMWALLLIYLGVLVGMGLDRLIVAMWITG